MKQSMRADLSALDIIVLHIDVIHISEHLVLVSALLIHSESFKHPLALIEASTEHRAVLQSFIYYLI